MALTEALFRTFAEFFQKTPKPIELKDSYCLQRRAHHCPPHASTERREWVGLSFVGSEPWTDVETWKAGL
ncbi:MAG: hypothetical protein DMG06_30060 [Acidobacteria bacterium]|nr:MAG: hypothetical protein DMG06_30060 [Acidobacteriota bacterium]